MRRIFGVGLLAVLLSVVAACGDRDAQPDAGDADDAAPAAVGRYDSGPVTVQLVGDSMLRLQEKPIGAGQTTVECAIQFHARVTGQQNQHAVMQGGQIQYWWWQTNGDAGGYEWDQRSVTQLWGDSILPAGHERISHPQGFGQSPPGRLVRARVTFDYRTSDSDEVKQTEPYRFYCY